MQQYFQYTPKDIKNLKKCDKQLASYIEAIGEIQREVEPDLFTALINSIVGQQISVKAQITVWKRFLTKLYKVHENKNNQEQNIIQDQIISKEIPSDKLFNNEVLDLKHIPTKDYVTPENIICLSESDIQCCGMTFKKAQNILDFVHKIHNKDFDLDGLQTKSDDEIIRDLCTLKGVGKWTAEMLMLFSMQRPNILSFDDLGIQKGLCALYKTERLTKEDRAFYKARFTPYGSLASLYLWEIAAREAK